MICPKTFVGEGLKQATVQKQGLVVDGCGIAPPIDLLRAKDRYIKGFP